MARVVKSSGVRREEILDAAEALIIAKGYQRMTVEDVLHRVGIAKGTLYHHFPGKEAILEGIVERQVAAMEVRARSAATAPKPATARLLAVIGALRVDGASPAGALAEHFNDTRNAEFHVLLLGVVLRRIAPVVAQVIDEGVGTGALTCTDPLSAAEAVLTLISTLLDDGVVPSSPDERSRRERFITVLAARVLGADPSALLPALDGATEPHPEGRRR